MLPCNQGVKGLEFWTVLRNLQGLPWTVGGAGGCRLSVDCDGVVRQEIMTGFARPWEEDTAGPGLAVAVPVADGRCVGK